MASRAVTKDIFSQAGRVKSKGARLAAGKAFDFVMDGTSRMGQSVGKSVERIQSGMSKALKSSGRALRRSSPVTNQVLRETTFSGEEDTKARKNESAQAAFKRTSDELSRAVANMPATQQHIHDRVAQVTQLNIGVGDKLAAHSKAVLQFLHTKMPKDPGVLQQFGVSKWRPTESDLDKWARYVNAAKDPAAVVERFGSGHMSREDAETLRVLYPGHFEKVQEWVMENLPDIQENMSYERRIQISTLMGVPADPTVSRVDVWQSSFVASETPQSPMRKLQMESSQSETQAQQLSGVRK
jgi:hypothetical protein